MSRALLVVRAGDRLCALPVEHVEEAMRPLALEVLPDVPDFVRGVSNIRGKPTPVVDLQMLLGDNEPGEARRLVTLKIQNHRRVGLLVGEVLGVQDARSATMEELPPLLQDASAGVIDDLARLDNALLTILRAGNLLPQEVWERVPDSGEPS